jgi:hypothetical protein
VSLKGNEGKYGVDRALLVVTRTNRESSDHVDAFSAQCFFRSPLKLVALLKPKSKTKLSLSAAV